MSKHNEEFIKQIKESTLDKKLKAQILAGVGAENNSKMFSFDDKNGEICALIHNLGRDQTMDECGDKSITINSFFATDVVADGCMRADIPDLSPTVSVRWGDSLNDNMETSDDEVVCINICNHYSNVGFNNIKLGYAFFTNDTNIDVTPNGGLCFGDLAPCEKRKPACVSNQLSIVTKTVRQDIAF